MRYTLLVRGQSHRFGCDADGHRLQLACLRSQQHYIGRPLARHGHRLEIILSFNSFGGCFGASNESRRRLLVRDLQEAANGSPVSTVDVHHVYARSQSLGLRYSLNRYFRETAADARSADWLLLSRFDLRLLRPLSILAPRGGLCQGSTGKPTSELLQPPAVLIASRCAAKEWSAFHCTVDTFYAIPRHYVPAFNRSVGQVDPSHKTSRCCFRWNCQFPHSGHACLDMLFANGVASACFLWPPLERNTKPPDGPDYQCCRKGMTEWSNGNATNARPALGRGIGGHGHLRL